MDRRGTRLGPPGGAGRGRGRARLRRRGRPPRAAVDVGGGARVALSAGPRAPPVVAPLPASRPPVPRDRVAHAAQRRAAASPRPAGRRLPLWSRPADRALLPPPLRPGRPARPDARAAGHREPRADRAGRGRPSQLELRARAAGGRERRGPPDRPRSARQLRRLPLRRRAHQRGRPRPPGAVRDDQRSRRGRGRRGRRPRSAPPAGDDRRRRLAGGPGARGQGSGHRGGGGRHGRQRGHGRDSARRAGRRRPGPRARASARRRGDDRGIGAGPCAGAAAAADSIACGVPGDARVGLHGPGARRAATA